MLISPGVPGRDRELAVVHAAVSAALDRGFALLVVGEAGIGKSTLLEAARTTARGAGYAVLHAEGVESEMHLPFAALEQALTPLMGHLPSLAPAQRDAVATAFGLSVGPVPDLFLVAEAAFALLSGERAERPVLVTVDDVHWLDPQSHQILTFLAHRGVGAGITVMGATRPEHPGPFADAGFAQLVVEGVDDRTAAALLSVHEGALSAGDLTRIRQQAQGNPLALLELPRSWGDGPEAEGHPIAVSARLERAFAGRVAGLPAGARDALLVAAVGSSNRTLELLSALAVFGTREVTVDLLRPAVDAGLIATDRDEITFRHPLIRSGVLGRETLTRRHAAHAALAAVLDSDRYRQTWHRAWSILGPDDSVADALDATVPDSLRRGAVMSAVASLERAAQLTTASAGRGHRLMQAAGRAFDAGRPDVVARLLREASQIDLSGLDETTVTWLTEALNDDVRADSGLVRRLCDAARRAQGLGDDGLALNLLLGAALRCWWADSGTDDRAQVVRALDHMAAQRDDPRHLAALAVAEPVLRGADVLTGLRSRALADIHDGDSLRVYGMAAYGTGDLVLATDLLDRAEESFRREGRLGMLPVVLALQLQIRLDLGDWSGALLAGQEVVTISRETGQAVFADNHILVEARGMALRGEWQAALRAMAAAESEAIRSGVNDRICLAYQARGAALLSADQPAEAFASLIRQYDPEDPGYHLRESFAGVALMAEAAVACGRVEHARDITRGLDAVAVITPSPLLEINLLYAHAVLAPAGLRDVRYEEAFARDLTRWPWMHARLQLAHGQWLAQTGRCGQAARSLHAAASAFDRLGAARWTRSADASLASLRGAGSEPQ